MVDPEQPDRLVEIFTTEGAAQRDAWTPGHKVGLSDGESWRLPRIDWLLLLLCPKVVATISRTFDLAREVVEAEPDVERHAIATAVYHAQLA